jgi:hypothetical protein
MDGLDELYANDLTFFDYALDLITQPNSQAQILICCRDSLLTTSFPFIDFRDCFGTSDQLKVYRLHDWERPAKRHLAWLRLEQRAPASKEADTPAVNGFLQQVDNSESLSSLTRLPYYCVQLVDLYRDGELREFRNELELFDFIIKAMLRREQDKGILDFRVFEREGLEEWLQSMAIDYLEGARRDLDQNNAIEYARVVIRDDIDPEAHEDAVRTLLQFPFFQAGLSNRFGMIRFAHELIAEALAAKGYVRQLAKSPAEIGERLGYRSDLAGSVLARHIAANLNIEQERAITDALSWAGVSQVAFRNLLTILLLARPRRDLFKDLQICLETRDLEGMSFVQRDLTKMSFRNADLSHVTFRDCDLDGAYFEGAVLVETEFDGATHLVDAQFGDGRRIQSVRVGRHRFSEKPKIDTWLEDATGHVQPKDDPCPTALQLRHIFGKFITPLGEPRQDQLGARGMLAGRRFPGAAPVEECLSAACQFGFLIGPDFRDRYRRAHGDKYAEMVQFVRDGQVSNELGQLLAKHCRRRGCLHTLVSSIPSGTRPSEVTFAPT